MSKANYNFFVNKKNQGVAYQSSKLKHRLLVPCISLYRPGQTVTISKQTIHTGYSFLTGIERDVEVQEVKTNIFHCFSNKFIKIFITLIILKISLKII